jgi:hypothetical protein
MPKDSIFPVPVVPLAAGMKVALFFFPILMFPGWQRAVKYRILNLWRLFADGYLLSIKLSDFPSRKSPILTVFFGIPAVKCIIPDPYSAGPFPFGPMC